MAMRVAPPEVRLALRVGVQRQVRQEAPVLVQTMVWIAAGRAASLFTARTVCLGKISGFPKTRL